MSQPDSISTVQAPPSSIPGILSRLGPGLIIAGSIVGSGELIATTKTGAEAGFALLWLIVIGCVIKVFTQVEFGRYCISTGRTSMDGINELPGPRLHVNWVVWYWLVMFLFSTAQLGGIVGGVGQAAAIACPFTGDFNELLRAQRAWDDQADEPRRQLHKEHSAALKSEDRHEREQALIAIQLDLEKRLGPRPVYTTYDDLSWALGITLVTAVMLVVGRYGLVQSVSTVLVASFTLITIGNVCALQTQPDWAIRWQDIADGLSFHLPSAKAGSVAYPIGTALAAFGIIGVGAAELITYPYWCLEKGYARFTGPRDDSPAWAERATGWLRVMRWDAWCSMCIYTLATVAFYFLGAAVLSRQGSNPAGDQLVPTLAQMYEPVFGTWAPLLFLLGAVAVLYSTFFVASAGNARVVADAVRVFGLRPDTHESQRRWIRFFCGLFPCLSMFIYYFFPDPTRLVLASGICQAIMLPMLGAAALYFRYLRCDRRITPGRAWDLWLWISALGLLVAGGWGAVMQLAKLIGR